MKKEGKILSELRSTYSSAFSCDLKISCEMTSFCEFCMITE